MEKKEFTVDALGKMLLRFPSRCVAILCALVLCLGMGSALAVTYPVEINEANFPDVNFRKYISEVLDTDHTGSLSQAEIEATFLIAVTESEVANLQGIAYFTELKRLFCDKNNLTSLDVSNNTKLNIVHCDDNQLTSVTLGSNLYMKEIFFARNELTSIDISKLDNLLGIYVADNELTAIDISHNNSLVNLSAANNRLKSIDVSNNLALAGVDLRGNQIASIKLDDASERMECMLSPQKISSDALKQTGPNTWEFPLFEYVALKDLKNVEKLASVGHTVELNSEGKVIITGNTVPTELTYTYVAAFVPGFSYEMEVIIDLKRMKTVKFDLQGGTGSQIEIEINAGEKPASLPTPVKQGYTFLGWYTEPNGEGKQLTTDTVVNDDMVVYAYWEKKVSPQPPTTGDTTNIGLFIVLAMLSFVGVVTFRKKVNSK